MIRSYGYAPSVLDGKELKYGASSVQLPDEYELSDLPSVINQGSSPICVSAVVSDMVNWKLNYRQGKKELSPYKIYEIGETEDNGMNPKKAFEALVKKTDYGFKRYAMVGSEMAAKDAILTNGPLMVALNVYSYGNEFWKGNDYLGGHAVSLVGWDENGFKLRNSWGYEYGNNGYWTFPYEDFGRVLEAWILL